MLNAAPEHYTEAKARSKKWEEILCEEVAKLLKWHVNKRRDPGERKPNSMGGLCGGKQAGGQVERKSRRKEEEKEEKSSHIIMLSAIMSLASFFPNHPSSSRPAFV